MGWQPADNFRLARSSNHLRQIHAGNRSRTRIFRPWKIERNPFLGNKMSKWMRSALYLAVALICSLISLRIIGHIGIDEPFKDRQKNGCWELEHCQISFGHLLLMAVALLPPIGASMAVANRRLNSKPWKEVFIKTTSILLFTIFWHTAYSIFFEWATTK